MGVVIYTKPGCPYCATARNELIAGGVEYEEIDVTTTRGAQDRLAELTFGSMMVPVIVEEDGSVRVSSGGG
ncbi:MAG: glutaredoxin family protein [Actinobacteria bacterium]|nr:glutaredoxin family protein [Actinomycetota bacterium]